MATFYSALAISSEIRALLTDMISVGGTKIELEVDGYIRNLRVTMMHQTGDELRVLCEDHDVHVTLYIPNALELPAQASVTDKRKG